ncbi:MAG: hypothetical protein K2Q01_06490 [Rickettsiales bacterium]|nr:hypothetical protein [Rickettsiales bacterium]
MIKTAIFCFGCLFAGIAIFLLSCFFPPIGLAAHVFAATALTRLAVRYLPPEHVIAAIFIYTAPFIIPFIGGLYGLISGWQPMSENAVLAGVGLLGALLGYWGFRRGIKPRKTKV